MERGSEFTPVEGKTVSDDFAGATFGGKWKFPRIGTDLMHSTRLGEFGTCSGLGLSQS